jgi:hypothetical protein
MSHVEHGRILKHSKMRGPERMILSTVSYYCNCDDDDGAAWPSIKTIATGAGYSERQVQRTVSKWIENPQEVYVVPGGGRKKSHTFIIVVGCTYQQVIDRLTPFIGLSQAVKFADAHGFQKGDTDVTVNKEGEPKKGDIYDSTENKRVTSTTKTTPEKVTRMSPEPELKSKPELKPIEPVSSFSPPPDETPISPPIVKEKELENIIPLEIENSSVENPKPDHDECVPAFARLCGFNINTSAANEIADKLGEGVEDILRSDPMLTAKDFEYFRIYYNQLPPLPNGKKRPLCPAIKFVVTGWRGYCDWYNLWSDETEGRYLEGEGYVQRPRWQWHEIEAGTFQLAEAV